MPRRAIVLLVLGALWSVGASCGGSADPSATVSVFAASSLTDILPEIAEGFEAQSAAEIELTFAGSSSLREQILDGAAADVFLSANATVMQTLVEAELIEGTPVVVARNRLQIAVPLGNPAGITGLRNFEDESLRLGVCAAGVPCGDLALDAFEALDVRATVDTNEANVRSLLAKVELGELDAALVYRTDVLTSSEVEAVQSSDLDDLQSNEAEYIAGIVSDATPQAESFLEFLQSDVVIDAFTDAGFTP